MREAEIKARVRLALGRSAVTWNNPVGYDEPRKIQYGLAKGSSDLVGIFEVPVATIQRPTVGVFLALEIKSATGRLRPEQVLFLDLVRKLGGLACVARSPEEAAEQVAQAKAGIW